MAEQNRPHRHTMRLQGHDYSLPDAYFITIVIQDRRCLLGEITDGEARLNDAGQMVGKWWKELTNKFQSVELDEYIIMPNHFHAILWLLGIDLHFDSASSRKGFESGEESLVGADLRVGPGSGETPVQRGRIQTTLPEIMQWFKTMTTNEYIRGVNQNNWPPFPGKLWQRSYYDHIVRDGMDLDNIRRYIQGNPVLWEQDNENPKGTKLHE